METTVRDGEIVSTKSSLGHPTEEWVWSCVEDGFYVASYADKFLGFVDRIDQEIFQVCNERSQQIGLFKDLNVAMQCLVQYTSIEIPSATDRTEK